MTRFGDLDSYDPDYPNQGDLWWANCVRATRGKRGKAAIAALRAALLALPAPRLIEGHLATTTGDVCAVGAYVAAQRTAQGKPRQQVLQELATASAGPCSTCWHSAKYHDATGCTRCHYLLINGDMFWRDKPERWRPPCTGYVPDSYNDDPAAADMAAAAGAAAGMTYTLAWRLAYLNDEEYGGLSPEQRYAKVLAWCDEELAA